MDYTDKCEKPIPIGKQKFAYQCENIVLEPLFGTMNIRGYKPYQGGKEPYPNAEKELIEHYDLKIEKFTGNSMYVTLTKKFKDGSEQLVLTNVSFSDLVNRIFEGNPANFINHEAPINNFQ
jgi:hypothetical protein